MKIGLVEETQTVRSDIYLVEPLTRFLELLN